MCSHKLGDGVVGSNTILMMLQSDPIGRSLRSFRQNPFRSNSFVLIFIKLMIPFEGRVTHEHVRGEYFRCHPLRPLRSQWVHSSVKIPNRTRSGWPTFIRFFASFTANRLHDITAGRQNLCFQRSFIARVSLAIARTRRCKDCRDESRTLALSCKVHWFRNVNNTFPAVRRPVDVHGRAFVVFIGIPK